MTIKRTFTRISLSILFLFLTACSYKNQTLKHDELSSLNTCAVICDQYDEVLTNVSHYGMITQTDNGFVYAQDISNISEDLRHMKYYYYDWESRSHSLLGVIENWAYEAIYDTKCINEHMYTIIATGQACETIYLYDFDLQNHNMKRTELHDAVAPYCSWTYMDENLFIVVPEDDSTQIYKYNIYDQQLQEIQSYVFDSMNNTGDAIRHIDSDTDYIYLLRLSMKAESEVYLYIDIMDTEWRFLKTIDITNEVRNNMNVIEDDKNNELRQLVSHFDVYNNFIYYENFSVSRALFEMDTITKHFDAIIDENFFKGICITENNPISTYYRFYEDTIYVFNAVNRTMGSHKFQNENLQIHFLSQNCHNDLFVFTTDRSDKAITKIYYIPLSSLT